MRNYIQELFFVRSITNGAEGDQSSVFGLPWLLNGKVWRHKVDDWLHDLTFDKHGQCLEAASGRNRVSPIILIFILLKVYDGEPFKDHSDEILAAAADIIVALDIFGSPFRLIFNESGPKFESLRADFVCWLQRSIGCNFTYLVEVELNRVILLSADLSEAC